MAGKTRPPSEVEWAYIDTLTINVEEGRVYRNGRELGSNVGGYIKIGFNRVGHPARQFFRSHLIWWAATGEWPEIMVDHREKPTTDDRISNLRNTNNRVNMLNRETRPRLLPKGVYLRNPGAPKPYKATITLDRKQVHLGNFATAEEASEAFNTAYDTHVKGLLQ